MYIVATTYQSRSYDIKVRSYSIYVAATTYQKLLMRHTNIYLVNSCMRNIMNVYS